MAENGGGPGGLLKRAGHGTHNDGKGTGDGTGDKTQQPTAAEQQAAQAKAAAEKLHADTTPPKPTMEGTNNGQGNGKTDRAAEKSEPPAGGSSPVNRGGISSDGNSFQQKTESKAASTPSDSKTLSTTQQPTATSAEKSNAAAVKPQAEQVHTSGQNKELIATNPYNAPPKGGDKTIQPQEQSKPEATKYPPSLHEEGKEQTAPSAKALAQSDRNTDNQQTKTNAAPIEKPTNEPIGRSGHEIEQHGPPAQQPKSSENTNQSQKITTPETKPEPKSGSIPSPTPIPTDIHQPQKLQNPASAANQPESAPIAPQKDLSTKPVDTKMQLGDNPKPPTADGKPASEAAQGKNFEPPRSPAVAGELGAHNSAGGERIAHEPPVTKESNNPNGGTSKQFDVAQEATTTEARGDRIQSQSQIKTSEDIATGRLDTTLIEKNRDHQVENTILPTGKNTVGEPSVKVDTGKTDKQEKPPEVDSVTGDKPPLKVPVTDAAAGGSALAIPSDHRSDKVTAEPVERIILKVENGVFNLAEKGTVSKLLGVLEQIKTGKVTATDPESTAFAHAVLSVKDANWVKVEVALKALDSSLLNNLLVDKLPPEQAENQKLARWELPKEREKSAKLEAENQELKRDRYFLQGFVESIKGFFADFVHGRKPLPPDASGPEIVEDISIEARNRNAVEQFWSRTQTQLAKYEVGEDTDQADVDDAPVDISSSKSIQPIIATRATHVVETLSNCEEIALLKLGNSALSDLLAQINQIESTLIDGRPVRRDLLPGEVLFLPTEQEIQAVMEPPNRGAAL